MNSLRIEATDDSPFINFDIAGNYFIISGESRPENASKFYAPVIKWLNEYDNYITENAGKSQPLTFAFKLDYFNSSSAKYIMDIMLLLKNFIQKAHKIDIEWHYDNRDEDMLEAGKEFASKFYSNIEMKMVKF